MERRSADSGLKELAALTSLTTLSLSDTQVTDAGLKELTTLKNLTAASRLYRTQIPDASEKELAKLQNLTALDLRLQQRSRTREVKDLQKELPKCEITK